MTLRQFTLLADRYKERVKREDRRSGEVAAAFYNTNNDWEKRPKGWNWLDFYPEHRPPKPVQTDEEMFEAMQLWHKATEMVS